MPARAASSANGNGPLLIVQSPFSRAEVRRRDVVVAATASLRRLPSFTADCYIVVLVAMQTATERFLPARARVLYILPSYSYYICIYMGICITMKVAMIDLPPRALTFA